MGLGGAGRPLLSSCLVSMKGNVMAWSTARKNEARDDAALLGELQLWAQRKAVALWDEVRVKTWAKVVATVGVVGLLFGMYGVADRIQF